MCCTSASRAGRPAWCRTADNSYQPADGSSAADSSRVWESPAPTRALPAARAKASGQQRFPATGEDLSCCNPLPNPLLGPKLLETHGSVSGWAGACAGGGWEGLPVSVRRAAAAASLGVGCSDGRGPLVSVAPGTDPVSLHECGTAQTLDCSERPQSSCFGCCSRHIDWPTGDIAHCDALQAVATAATVAAAAQAAARPMVTTARASSRRHAATATGGRRTAVLGFATEDVGAGGYKADSDADGAGEDNGDAEMRALLRPGGSPCLPMEDGWELLCAAQRTAAAAAAVAAAAASGGDTSLPSDELLREPSQWWRGSLSLGDDGCSTEDLGGEWDAAAVAAMAAPPQRPSSSHRACQFGYAVSAPAHATAAAAAAAMDSDLALAYLRAAADGDAWRQVLQGTLSAPAAAVAAAATMAKPPPPLGPLAESSSPSSQARPRALAAPAAMPLFTMELASEVEYRQTAPERVKKATGFANSSAPASAAAASASAAAAAPPPRSAGPAATRPRPSSARAATRTALVAAAGAPAAAAHSRSDGLSLRHRSATGTSAVSAEGTYFGIPERGLSTLLQELATTAGPVGGCCERSLGGGGCDKAEERRRPAASAGRTFGRLGRGLLGCFTAGR